MSEAEKNKTLSEEDEIIRTSLTYEQARDLIGSKRMTKFMNVMRSQRWCIRSDGRIGFFKRDVERYQRLIKENRDLTSVEWD